MSRGTPHISLRIAPDVLAGIDQAVDLLRKTKGDDEYNRTAFIMHAIEEKLAKLERGRRSNRKARPADADTPAS